MRHVVITKGWFRSAGNVYHWGNDFSTLGVGIDMKILRKESKIAVTVDGTDYILDCTYALNFIELYRSDKRIGSTHIGVVSKSILKSVPQKKAALVPTNKEKTDVAEQLKMF